MAKSFGNGMLSERIQLKAIFWHSIMFLLPVYCAWQGLYLQRQVWFGLMLWSLMAIFFLFFVKMESLCLQSNENSEQKKNYFLSLIEKILLFFGRAKLQKTVDTSELNTRQNVIFGDYANNGKGQIAWTEPDDGISIEAYLKQQNKGKGKTETKTGFDWNWKNSNSIDDESHLLLEKQRFISPQQYLCNWFHAGIKLLNKFWSDWEQIWCLFFPAKTSRFFALVLFWLSSLLWFPVSYWLLHSANVNILELGGFIYYGQSARGSLLVLLLFANLCLPILTTQVGNKLQRSLSPIGKFRIVYRICDIFIELGYSLASLLVLWFFIASRFGVASGLALLLIFANLYLSLNFRRNNLKNASKLLLWFRQVIFLSIALGVSLHLL